MYHYLGRALTIIPAEVYKFRDKNKSYQTTQLTPTPKVRVIYGPKVIQAANLPWPTLSSFRPLRFSGTQLTAKS